MPETVGHNVWSKEIKGSRESGSMMKTKFRVYMGHVLHRIKLGAGCGRLTARAEGRQPTHGSVCRAVLPPATSPAV